MATSITKNQWNKVADNVNAGYIHKLNNFRKKGFPTTRVWQYFVDTGGSAPTDLTDGVIWDDLTLEISSISNIDIYLYPLTDMKVRVDT